MFSTIMFWLKAAGRPIPLSYSKDKVFEVIQEGVIVFLLVMFFIQEILGRREGGLKKRRGPTKKVSHEIFYIKVLDLKKDQLSYGPRPLKRE